MALTCDNYSCTHRQLDVLVANVFRYKCKQAGVALGEVKGAIAPPPRQKMLGPTSDGKRQFLEDICQS